MIQSLSVLWPFFFSFTKLPNNSCSHPRYQFVVTLVMSTQKHTSLRLYHVNYKKRIPYNSIHCIIITWALQLLLYNNYSYTKFSLSRPFYSPGHGEFKIFCFPRASKDVTCVQFQCSRCKQICHHSFGRNCFCTWAHNCLRVITIVYLICQSLISN